MESQTPAIPRHRTALRRTDLSRPAKCALRDGLITAETSVLDYGCGHGIDVDLLGTQGIACAGWDPVFFPDRPVQEADVVQLGYVINVIEDLGTFPSVITRLMPEVLPRVLRKHGTGTEVVFQLGDNREHLAALRAGSIDIAICNREEEEPAEFDLRQVYPAKSEIGFLFGGGAANTTFLKRLEDEGRVDLASLMNHLRTQPLYLLKDESEKAGVPSIEAPVVELLRSYCPPAETGPGSVVYVPTYRHLLLCLRKSDGAGVGPNELEGEDRKGGLSFVGLSRIVDSGTDKERARLMARARALSEATAHMIGIARCSM
jgi:hypothetical protein